MSEKEPIKAEVSSGALKPLLGLFGAANCKRLDLRYRVTRDKFDIARFLAFFQNETEEEANSIVVCRTLDPDRLDYHMHFDWLFGKEVATFHISFISGVARKTDGEREPYAEHFMPWFGNFFSNETAHADIHSEFDYALEDRQSRFPLPLKVNVPDDLEAEIFGIALSFASTPEGISSARIQHGKKRLNIEPRGTVRTKFGTFDLQAEIIRLSSFVLRLTEARNTKQIQNDNLHD